MGAWIETDDKNLQYIKRDVAPYVGAWIETKNLATFKGDYWVAPYVGAWIETPLSGSHLMASLGRTLRGCVD